MGSTTNSDDDCPERSTEFSVARFTTFETRLVDGAFIPFGKTEFLDVESSGRENATDDDDGDGLVDCVVRSCTASAACRSGFERGDAAASGAIELTDGIFMPELPVPWRHHTEPTRQDAADVDDSGAIDITDGPSS